MNTTTTPRSADIGDWRPEDNAFWEDTVNVQVVGVCIDYLDSLTGDEALTITDPEETEQ